MSFQLQHTPEHEKNNVKLEVFGLWQTEIYIPPPVKNVKKTINITLFASIV